MKGTYCRDSCETRTYLIGFARRFDFNDTCMKPAYGKESWLRMRSSHGRRLDVIRGYFISRVMPEVEIYEFWSQGTIEAIYENGTLNHRRSVSTQTGRDDLSSKSRLYV